MELVVPMMMIVADDHHLIACLKTIRSPLKNLSKTRAWESPENRRPKGVLFLSLKRSGLSMLKIP